ncbi:MAG: WhiB family transcriptional regulator [Gemmatimonadetes bacterium]|nr:WhiB family transcriptional regulator [Gemmatimonadota bacterium]
MTPQQQAMAALDAVDAGDLDTAYAIARTLPVTPPAPIRLDPGWASRAECRDTMGELDGVIFAAGRKPPAVVRDFIADYCKPCPVKAECYNAGRDEPHGVWGGIWHGGDK